MKRILLIGFFILISITLSSTITEVGKDNVKIILSDILDKDGGISQAKLAEAKKIGIFEFKFEKASSAENVWVELSIPTEYNPDESIYIPVPWVPIEIYKEELIFSNFNKTQLMGNENHSTQYYIPLNIREIAPRGLDKLYIKLAFFDFRAVRTLEETIIGDTEEGHILAESRIRFNTIADHVFFFIGNLLIIVGIIALVIFIIRWPVKEYLFLIFSIMALATGLFHWLFSPFTNFLKINHHLRFHFTGIFYVILYYLLVIFINLLFKYKRKEVIIILSSFIISIPLIGFKILHPIGMKYIFTGYILILFIYTVIQIKNDHRFHMRSKIILALGFSVFLILTLLQFSHILERFHLVFSPFGIGIAVLSIIFAYFIFEHYKQSMIELEEQKLRLIKLEQNQLQSQLDALKNQIDPHFLFNNFGTLISLIEMDHQLAINFVEELSKVYRYILQIKDKELISVAEELDFTKSYIYLMKQRFRNHLQTTIDIDSKINSAFVIPLSLQSLVENAIKHNIISADLPLKIIIKNYNPDSINVINNYQPKRMLETSHKIGLDNLKKRFSFFTNEEIKIKHTETEFNVEIPVIKELA